MEKKVVTKAVLVQGLREVAGSDSGVRVDAIKIPDAREYLIAYSLPQVELERTVLFEHMQGRPLSAFFNGCCGDFTYEDGSRETTGNLLYVHGRSEALRGNITVSAVVLAQFPSDLSYREILPQLPEIYKIISSAL